MYISRMPLNGARRSAMELLTSPNKMHAAVEASFPPVAQDDRLEGTGEEGPAGRILWRIDSIPDAGRSAWLYVVSPHKPDFSHLCEQAGWPVEGRWESKEYAPLLNRIAEGQRWRFRLKANPVRKVLVDKGRSSGADVVGTVQGHVTVEQQMTWLLNRSEANGFRVACDGAGYPCLLVSERSKISFSHAGSKATLSMAVFDGILEVADASAFRHALCWGIGRAKAFGCGLLTVSPPTASGMRETL